MLTKLENQILMTVWKFQGEAYGLNVYQYLTEAIGLNVAVGVVCTTLDRLTRRGHVSAYKGEPTAIRGGMRKKLYAITAKGVAALEQSKAVHDAIWGDFGRLQSGEAHS